MDTRNQCQLTGLPQVSEGILRPELTLRKRPRMWLHRAFSPKQKRLIKTQIMKILAPLSRPQVQSHVELSHTAVTPLQAGDWVKVRSHEEITATLNTFGELKHCAFMPEMQSYCNTIQRVLKPVRRFLDERDYKVKKTSGIVLLEDVMCEGTAMFGQCDRGCLYFWQEEWLERLDSPPSNKSSDGY